MILPFMPERSERLQGEFAMSELWDFEDLMFGVGVGGVGIRNFLLCLLWFVVLIIVCGRALAICCGPIDPAGVFAGSGAFWGYAANPALAITLRGSIGV